VPNRHGSSDSYRYGFQGQEKDDEIKGEGNSLNYTFRMHDPRVGRFFAIDPLRAKYPHYSPYSFSGNKVIAFVELEGLEDRWVVKDNAVEHERGPRVGTMDSEATANAKLAESRRIHRSSGAPMLSQDNMSPSERTAHTRAIQVRLDKEKFDAMVYDNPTMMVAQGVGIGFQEAPGIIIPEIAVAKAVKVFKQTKMAIKAAKAVKAVNKADNGAYQGMEFLDDGIGFVKAPLEMQAPKITSSVDEVVSKYSSHIFSAKHIKSGIMNLGATKDDILRSIANTVERNAPKLKEGFNEIVTKMNGKEATVRTFVKDGKVISVNAFEGTSSRQSTSNIINEISNGSTK
jgi:RHS repeat-associated protein